MRSGPMTYGYKDESRAVPHAGDAIRSRIELYESNETATVGLIISEFYVSKSMLLCSCLAHKILGPSERTASKHRSRDVYVMGSLHALFMHHSDSLQVLMMIAEPDRDVRKDASSRTCCTLVGRASKPVQDTVSPGAPGRFPLNIDIIYTPA